MWRRNATITVGLVMACLASLLWSAGAGATGAAQPASEELPPPTTLTITKVGPPSVAVGGSITYTITITNTGDHPARGWFVGDDLPAGLAPPLPDDIRCDGEPCFELFDPFCGVNGDVVAGTGSIRCDGSDLLPGETFVLSITTKVLFGSGQIVNNAAAGWLNGADMQSGFVAAPPVVTTIGAPATTGKLVIRKVAAGAGDQKFPLTVTRGDLVDEALLGDQEQHTVELDGSTDLPAGSYTLGEELVPGWRQDSVVCTGPSEAIAAGSTSVEVEPGKTNTCTVTNVRTTGSLMIEKVAVDAGEQQFSFEVSRSSKKDAFTLGDGDQHRVTLDGSVHLEPGAYAIRETGPTGWRQGEIVCSTPIESFPDVTFVTVQEGVDTFCVVTNVRNTGTLTIKKVAARAGEQQFSFEVSRDLAKDAFALGDGGQHQVAIEGTTHLAPGTYTLREVATPGWQPGSVTCNTPVERLLDGWLVTVQEGVNTVCTVTNVRSTARLTIKKVAPGATADEQFDIDVSRGTRLVDELHLGHLDQEVVTDGALTELEPGTYTLDEPFRDGWRTKSVACTKSGEPFFNRWNVALEAGDDVLCTFTNERTTGTLTIVKLSPDHSNGEEFPFSVSEGSAGTFARPVLGLGDQHTVERGGSIHLAPGRYTISEEHFAGWEVDSIGCVYGGDTPPTDGDPSANALPALGAVIVDLNAAENVVCTFVNRRLPTVDDVTDGPPGGATGASGSLPCTAVPGGGTTSTGGAGGFTVMVTGDASPGGWLDVSGGGFAPGEPVAVCVHSEPRLLDTVNADSDGAVATSVMLPADLPPGEHHIELRGLVSGRSAFSSVVHVAGSAPATSRGTTSRADLPRTGGVPWLAYVAGLLLAAGAVATQSARRMRRAAVRAR